MITVDNYKINADINTILTDLKMCLHNGKLSFFKPTSSGMSVPCPVHAEGLERHNSCYMTEDGVWHCFSCNAKGSISKFVQECFNCSEEKAKDWLIGRYGELMHERVQLADDICLPQFNKPKILSDSELVSYTSWTPYLAKRKLNRTVCEQFNVKYDPKTRQVVFPVYDTKGNLIMLAKRSIDTKVFFMTDNVEKPWYCLDKVINNNYNKCLVTEGPFDCLTGWCHNIPTIASFGNVSDSQVKTLNKSGINILYLAFDNDASGRAFRNTVVRKLDKRIMTVDIQLPVGRKDLNDLTEDEWQELIEKYNLPKIL